jgi:hypothetical protein
MSPPAPDTEPASEKTPPPTRAPRDTKKDQAEREHELKIQREAGWQKNVQLAIVCGTFVAIALCVSVVLIVHAGRETKADYSLNVSDLKSVSNAVWMCVAAVVTGGYVRQRRARKKAARNMGPRIAELERKLDKRRTSSGLAPDGDDMPEAGV